MPFIQRSKKGILRGTLRGKTMNELLEMLRTWYEGHKEQIQLQWIRYKTWYIGLGLVLIGILAYGLWGPGDDSNLEGVDEYEQGQSQEKEDGLGQSRGQGRANADSSKQGLYSNGYKKAKFSSDGGSVKDSNSSKTAKGAKNFKGVGNGVSGDEDPNDGALSLVYSVASIERPYTLEDVMGNEMVFKSLIGSGPLVKGTLDKNKKGDASNPEGEDDSGHGGAKGIRSRNLGAGGGQGLGHRSSSGNWSSAGASAKTSSGASGYSQAAASSRPLLLGLVGQDYAVISLNGQSLLLGVGESAGDLVLESIGDSGVSIRQGGQSQWLSL